MFTVCSHSDDLGIYSNSTTDEFDDILGGSDERKDEFADILG